MVELEHLIEQCTGEEREQILAAAYYVAFADGRFWRETALLDRIRRKLDVPAKTARRLKNRAARRPPKLIVPESHAARQLVYHYAVAVAGADGKLTVREREVAEMLGGHLELSKEQVAAELDASVRAEEPKLRQTRRSRRTRPGVAELVIGHPAPSEEKTPKPDDYPAMLAGLVGKETEAAAPGRAYLKGPTAIALVLANLVPAVGVLFFNWDVFTIVLLYWLENAVVGVVTIAQIVAGSYLYSLLVDRPSGETSPPPLWKRVVVPTVVSLIFVPFFIFHYGMFMFVHGVFLFSIFEEYNTSSPLELLAAVESMLSPAIAIAVAAFFVQHGFAFFSEYIGKRKYVTMPGPVSMGQPYPRIAVLHVAIILGGILVQVFSMPIIFLLLLIAMKTGLDLRLQFRNPMLFSP